MIIKCHVSVQTYNLKMIIKDDYNYTVINCKKDNVIVILVVVEYVVGSNVLYCILLCTI